MTYFQFLWIFLGIPLTGIVFLTLLDYLFQKSLPALLTGASFWIVLLGHILVAVLYTTPWDNYLVATGVWYYDPNRVSGITLGWVPLEEYIFFIMQTLLTGLWLGWLLRRFKYDSSKKGNDNLARWVPLTILVGIWVPALIALLIGWKEGTYLCLILVWALPPMMIQFAFGGDILIKFKFPIFVAIFTAVIYLSSADSFSIREGTWSIDPRQSTKVFLGGVLPIEEFLFFLMTNALIVFGMTLVLANVSHVRYRSWKQQVKLWFRRLSILKAHKNR